MRRRARTTSPLRSFSERSARVASRSVGREVEHSAGEIGPVAGRSVLIEVQDVDVRGKNPQNALTKAISSASFFFSRSSKFDRPNVVFSLSLRLILILVASRVPRWSVMIIVIVVRWPRLSDFRFEKKKKRKRIQKKGKFDLREETSVRLCVLIFGSSGKVRIDRSVSVDFILSSFLCV